MTRTRFMLVALIGLGATMANVAAAQGNPPARPPGQQQPSQMQTQQMQMHQQMMVQMQDMVQRMTQLQQRAHQLAQGLQQQTQNRAQMTEQHRLMVGTANALDQNAQQLRTLAERAQDMIRSRDFQRDQDMQRDMDRLRQHLNTMATALDGSLQVMERLQQRLQTAQGK